MKITPSRHRAAPLAVPFAASFALAACLLTLTACSERPAPATPPASGAPVAPAASAATPPAAAAPAAKAAPRQLPLNVQGVASAGLTVRVKGIELGEDATILTVSASFGNRGTNFTNLGETDTYLVDPAGNRLALKRPDDNRYLRIATGDTMEGQLVFLGSVPAATPQLKLVINDGQAGDDTAGPGLSIALPLQ